MNTYCILSVGYFQFDILDIVDFDYINGCPILIQFLYFKPREGKKKKKKTINHHRCLIHWQLVDRPRPKSLIVLIIGIIIIQSLYFHILKVSLVKGDSYKGSFMTLIIILVTLEP